MKRILYLNNYLSNSIISSRRNKNIFSQAANNKISGIIDSLKTAGCDIKIISSGLVNSKTGKVYNIERDMCNGCEVIYAPIWDIPFINTVSSILAIYKIIKREHKERNVDNIVFYNYKPEVAWAALLAKKRLHIPITVEIEDGYSNVDGISRIKRWIFTQTEKVVSKYIDSALCVNSAMSRDLDVPSVVVRGVVNNTIVDMAKTHDKSQRNMPRVLFSSTIDEVRGARILLEALNYTTKEFELLITGRDDRGICRQCEDSRMRYLGFLSYEDLQYNLLDADILLQCQLEKSGFSQVSFPSKVFEYIATGNLIISSSMKDVIDFAGDSFIFYYNDSPKELATAIDKAIDSLKTKEVQQKIEKLVLENTAEQVGKRILKVLI